MDDQTFSEIEAAVFGDGGTPSDEAAPSMPEEVLGLQDATQITDSDAEIDAAPIDPESGEAEQPVPFETLQAEWQQRQTEYEQRIAEYEAERAQERARQDQLAQWKAQMVRQQDEQQAQELAKQLHDELGPEAAQQFVQRRTFLAQERDNAWSRAGQMENALEALTLALEHETPDKVSAIVSRAEALLSYGTHEERVRVLEQERQQNEAVNARFATMEQTIRDLQMQLEAQRRDPRADAVEGARAGNGSADWQSATGFDEFFNGLAGEFPAWAS
jgi:tetratricopeptide (TPR) repeat protein